MDKVDRLLDVAGIDEVFEEDVGADAEHESDTFRFICLGSSVNS